MDTQGLSQNQIAYTGWNNTPGILESDTQLPVHEGHSTTEAGAFPIAASYL